MCDVGYGAVYCIPLYRELSGLLVLPSSMKHKGRSYCMFCSGYTYRSVIVCGLFMGCVYKLKSATGKQIKIFFI